MALLVTNLLALLATNLFEYLKPKKLALDRLITLKNECEPRGCISLYLVWSENQELHRFLH